MAIIVEEEKKKGHGIAVFGWIIIMAIIVVGIYDIFFSAPSSAQVVVPPSNFAQLTSLSEVTLSPEDVISSSSFQALKQYVTPPASSTPAAVGRTNPFVNP